MEPIQVLPPVPAPMPDVPDKLSPLAQAHPKNRRFDAGGLVTTVASTVVGVGLSVLADPVGAEAVVRRVVSATSTMERVLAGLGLAGFLYAAATRSKNA